MEFKFFPFLGCYVPNFEYLSFNGNNFNENFECISINNVEVELPPPRREAFGFLFYLLFFLFKYNKTII